MALSRRAFLVGGVAASATALSGCVSTTGSQSSQSRPQVSLDADINIGLGTCHDDTNPPISGFEGPGRYGVEAPAQVPVDPQYRSGDVVIDTAHQYLYLVGRRGTATRYVVGVGRSDTPSPNTVHQIFGRVSQPCFDDMEGNNGNALFRRGSGAILGTVGLYMRDAVTGMYEGYVIHGTNRPELLANSDRRVSHGCIRMFNGDADSFASSVRMGANVYFVDRTPEIGLTARASLNL